MLIKLLIIAVLLTIFISLGSALFYLLRGSGQSKPMVKALTLRIGLSLGLFILLLIAYSLGIITPHTLLL